ncbi:MAG: hypothetical protein ACOY40_19000 [Bacillota bacterium]
MRRIFFVLVLTFFLLIPPDGACPGHPGAAAASRYEFDNIAVFWVSGSQLKALNLVSIDRRKGQVGIIAIPTCTLVSLSRDGITVADLYSQKGMAGVMENLAVNFQAPVKKYILVPQQGLEKLSRCTGRINVMGKNTTLRDVFEGTYVDGPVDLQVEIRSLAAGVIKPSVLAHLPELLFIFVTEFQTNTGLGDLLNVYSFVCTGGPGVIKKNQLPGTPCWFGPQKVWLVDSQTWRSAIRAIMQQN